MNSTAEKFWQTRVEYPPVTFNFQRRYIDLGLMLRYISDVNSILDLGCGEGQALLMLRELTDINNYYAYDLSQVFVDKLIRRWGGCSGLDASVKNFTEPAEFPVTDMCICMGAMLYVNDEALKIMLTNIQSKIFICRVPCESKNRVEIDKFSEEYNDDYAAVYRTTEEYINILSEFFNVIESGRCYPDDFESEYGSKQFFFVCGRR